MRHHQVLANPRRDHLAALEVCFIPGKEGGSSFKNLMFLPRNLPGLPSGSVEGGMSNRIAPTPSVPRFMDLYLL